MWLVGPARDTELMSIGLDHAAVGLKLGIYWYQSNYSYYTVGSSCYRYRSSAGSSYALGLHQAIS